MIVGEIYEQAIDALVEAGCYRADRAESERVRARLFPDGVLDRELIATDFAVLANACELAAPATARVVLVEEPRPGTDRPLTGEKLSLVMSVYRAADFADATDIVSRILEFQGIGHSVGIHTADDDHPRALVATLPGVRVLVNQAHTFGNGGSFDNGLPFTLSMGCGTWAGNSISENLNIRHFINITHLVTTIPEDRPTEEDLFGSHWARYGR